MIPESGKYELQEGWEEQPGGFYGALKRETIKSCNIVFLL